MSNEIAGLACVDGDLHIASGVEFAIVGVDSLVPDLVLDLHVTMDLYVLNLIMVDMAEDLHVVLGEALCSICSWVVEIHLILRF